MAQRFEFDSLSALVAHAASNPGSSGHNRSSNWTTFSDCDSFDSAVQLAFGGWKEGTEIIDKLRATIKPKGLNPRSYVRRSVVGPGTFNMGAIVQGRPDAYVQLRKSNEIKHGNGKIVRILLNVAASGGISNDMIKMRGAAAIALADSLESQGRRCEIVLAFGSAPSGNVGTRQFFISVKKASERLNISKLAFCMAHPAMIRRIVFASLEKEGGSLSEQPAAVEYDNATITLGHMLFSDDNFRSINAARKWVRDELHKQGIRLADERGQIAG